jgi:hypothetical protein
MDTIDVDAGITRPGMGTNDVDTIDVDAGITRPGMGAMRLGTPA